MLCPIESTLQDFLEPAKPSHKKKSDKDREKDRVERELAIKAAEFYRKRQEEMNRPLIPREPLKRTANNNWVHVTCAVWTPEVKFGQAKALERSEGIPSIPSARYDETCKICKTNDGACVACLSCRAPGKQILCVASTVLTRDSPCGVFPSSRVCSGLRYITSQRISQRSCKHSEY